MLGQRDGHKLAGTISRHHTIPIGLLHTPLHRASGAVVDTELALPPLCNRHRLHKPSIDTNFQRNHSVPSDILLQKDWKNLAWGNDARSFRHMVPCSRHRIYSASIT